MKHEIIQDDVFKPVKMCVTFQTQEEVDRFFCVLNHSDILEFLCTDGATEWSAIREELPQKGYHRYFKTLLDYLRAE